MRNRRGRQSGQAIVEFACVAMMMMVMVCGLIDFGRAIYQKQVLTNLSREGSNLASRGTDLATSASTVIAGAPELNLTVNGYVIVTSVANNAGTFKITGQITKGGKSHKSKVGNGVGNPGNVPKTAVAIPQPNQTVYVTEVFCSYQPVTPIGKLLNLVMPSTVYDVAYF